MASIAYSFNPNAVPSSGYQPLPAGEYTLEIVESHYRPNANGTGMVLALKAQIIGGEYEGRPYFIWMDLENDDADKQNRGQRDFAGLRRATGVLAPDDTEELHFKPFRVKIGVQEKKVTGEPVNCIVQYLFDDAPIAA